MARATFLRNCASRSTGGRFCVNPRQKRSLCCSELVGGAIYLQASICMHANVFCSHRFWLYWECWLIWYAWLCAGMELLEHTTRAQVNPAFAPPPEKDKVRHCRGRAGVCCAGGDEEA